MRALLCVVAIAVGMPPAMAQQSKSDADIEAQLAAAREKLEEAAREVAQLSSQLTGPVMEDYLMTTAGVGKRAMLGITIGNAEDKTGVHVEGVTPGGPAAAAGLKTGDVIVGVDGKNLRSTDKASGPALVAHLRTVKPGDKVKVEYLRDGKTRTAEITTEAMQHPHVMAFPPMMGIGPAPGMAGEPFTMGFRAFPGAQFLDMELVTLTPKLGRYFGTDKGVLVVRGPRNAEFKLEEGDVIVDIDGRAPQNGAHALRILRSYQPGEKLTLNVLRDRKPVKLVVTMPKGAGGEVAGDAFFFNEPVPFTQPVPPPDDGPT
ncbi:MAG TPA: PDZ domain-containing protein [Steroidobacteraceae bacterium]|nr:PDZ domain-containing protein [Steroidobacteraceae bacterium]